MNAAYASCRADRHHKLSGIWTNVSEDILRYLTKSPENLAAGDHFKQRLSALLTPELLCLFIHRLAHYLWVNRWCRLAVLVSRFNFLVHKVNITSQSCIGPGCRLPHPAGVTFHGTAGRNLTLFQLAVCCSLEDRWEGSAEKGPQLGNDVTVGAHSALMGPIAVGDNSKIAFSVPLERDVPPRVLVTCNSSRQLHSFIATDKDARPLQSSA